MAKIHEWGEEARQKEEIVGGPGRSQFCPRDSKTLHEIGVAGGQGKGPKMKLG